MRYWGVDDAWVAIAESPDVDRNFRGSFADEVAIDFPSMGDPISRMRAAFVADDHASPLVAHVRLSASEACRGAKVPIDVPLTRVCRGCGGRGESWSASCAPCEGTGHATSRHPLTVTVPAGVGDGARFSFSVAHPRGHRANVEVRVAVL